MSLITSEKMHIPLSRPSIDGDDVAAVLEVLHSPSLSMGSKVRGFELAMARYAGTAVAVAVNSGTSGLHICLAALGIGPGDEVITTPFSFVASANCALYAGSKIGLRRHRPAHAQHRSGPGRGANQRSYAGAGPRRCLRPAGPDG